MLGHTEPNVTANTYGHLDVDDLRTGVGRLSFNSEPVPSEVLGVVVPRCERLGRGGSCASTGGPNDLGSLVARQVLPRESPALARG